MSSSSVSATRITIQRLDVLAGAAILRWAIGSGLLVAGTVGLLVAGVTLSVVFPSVETWPLLIGANSTILLGWATRRKEPWLAAAAGVGLYAATAGLAPDESPEVWRPLALASWLLSLIVIAVERYAWKRSAGARDEIPRILRALGPQSRLGPSRTREILASKAIVVGVCLAFLVAALARGQPLLLVFVLAFARSVVLNRYRTARRLEALVAEEVRSIDGRPPILLLRAFEDDRSAVQQNPRPGPFLSPLGMQPPTYEESVARAVSRFGPFLALGSTLRLGAARLTPCYYCSRDGIHPG